MTEDNIIWLVASLLVGVGSIPGGYLIVFVLDQIERHRRPVNGPTQLFIERVSAASDLVPIIGGLLGALAKTNASFDGCELRIFSNDGRYIVNSKRRKWRKEMRAWSNAGLKILYILIEADDEVRRGLSDLRQHIREGHFDAVALNKAALPDIARELETCHPTIFLGKGGRNAAWIEGFHPRGSTHAYDVEYISPRAMELSQSAEDTFRYYAAKLDAVLEHSHSLIDLDECENVAALEETARGKLARGKQLAMEKLARGKQLARERQLAMERLAMERLAMEKKLVVDEALARHSKVSVRERLSEPSRTQVSDTDVQGQKGEQPSESAVRRRAAASAAGNSRAPDVPALLNRQAD